MVEEAVSGVFAQHALAVVERVVERVDIRRRVDAVAVREREELAGPAAPGRLPDDADVPVRESVPEVVSDRPVGVEHCQGLLVGFNAGDEFAERHSHRGKAWYGIRPSDEHDRDVYRPSWSVRRPVVASVSRPLVPSQIRDRKCL